MRKGMARKKRADGFGRGGKVLIGLVGTHRGAGTTHTALLAASFASSILGEDVGLLEMNPHGDLEQMEWGLFREVEDAKRFDYRKVHFYKGITETQLPQILEAGHTCLIMDFGASLEQSWREFLRCDRKWVVCSQVEWKSMAVNRFLQRYGSLYGVHSWNYLIPFGNEKGRKWMKKELGVRADSIVYEPNPFTPSQESILLFRNIMNG